MNLKSFVLLLMLTIATALSAQKTDADSTKSAQRSMTMYAEVKDHLTHDPIKGLKAELLWAADSTHADTVHAVYHDEEFYKSSYMDFPIKQVGNYLLKVEAEGYVTKYIPIEVKRIYKHERYQILKNVYLRTPPKKNEINLDEFVVTATKLKFYMDGDTLVYDADAFNMAEGSMLDALIKKLPGVELEKGGVIKVNGRQVDALLLNGKNFFDSDRELLLENMPSYMVKNIQSYERVPESVKGSPRENTVKKELVMNVKLKREYATGWIANAEGGAGATFFRNSEGRFDTKYMGRLFGLRFTDNSRLNVYANVNNLNDTHSPGGEGEWSQLEQTGGLTTTYQVGGNYMRDKEDVYRYMGSVEASYTDTDNASNTNAATFLEDGDTYERSFQSDRRYSWDFRMNHDLTLDGTHGLGEVFKHYFVTFRPTITYNKWNNRGNNGSVTLAEDVSSQLGKAWMDSIMNPNACDLLRRYAINRTFTTQKGEGHTTNGSIDGFFTATPAHNDYINGNITYSYNFSDSKTDQFEHYRLDYPNGGLHPAVSPQENTQQSLDFRNRYNPTETRTQSASVGANFAFALDAKQHNRIEASYTFSYNYDKNNQPLYLLNKLKGWGLNDGSQETVPPLGSLPSMDEMLTTLDAENSSHSKTTIHSHTSSVNYSLTKGEDNSFTQLTFALNMPYLHERMDYHRGTQVDTLMSRNTFFLNPGVNFSHSLYKRNRHFVADYNIATTAPGMTSLLNIRDDSNPLYVTLGNPNLKNTRAHNLWMHYQDKFGKAFFNTSVQGTITENAVASGYIYNKVTGVKTVTPENVNGNWSLNIHVGTNFAFDKADKWRFNQRVSYGHTNSVDLNGTNLSERATKSVVKNDNINEYLSLTWRPKDKFEFGTSGEFVYQHSQSNRENFTNMNVYTFNYGARAQLELPWNMQVSTDITMYCRRGYSEPMMNTNELVWNARLAKRMMKGKLTLMFDGFDLLGNLSNVRRYVNAQGRTETFYNVIPSYGILHAIYRLNVQPKKKG